jgi:phosphate acetyltransferase
MAVMDGILAQAAARDLRVVFPEKEDPRITQAAEQLARDGLAQPIEVTDTVTDAQAQAMAATRGMAPERAARWLGSRPLGRAAAMVAAGEADLMVAGASSPTRRVIEAAGMCIGLSDGVRVPSSFFLMLMADGRALVFADCAVNVAPSADELASIATSSARSAQALLGRADVAMLSFSTGTSGAGASVDLVREAAQATGFTGPIQADAALNAAIAAKKGLGEGNANVLIFPDLNAGNIAYKLLQELGGAQALGPFLQGFRRPVCDLSRGASVEDIVKATAVSAAMA